MTVDQSSLGGRVTSRLPNYNHLKMARVTSVKDFNKFGKVEAIFLDYSQPSPIWVINDLDREPVEGDYILVGHMEGRKDVPYMVGFVKNRSYTTNFAVMKKDKIKLQLPIFDIGVKNGKSHKDTDGNLLDNSKQKERAYIEISPEHAFMSYPTDAKDLTKQSTLELKADGTVIKYPISPGKFATIEMKADGVAVSYNTTTIKLTASEVTIDSPGVIKHHGGSKGVAREGDAIEVVVDGVTYTGKITSASATTKVD